MHTPPFASSMRPLASAALVALGACLAAPAQAEQLIGLTTGNGLVRFDSATPGTVTAPVAITGLAAGESILSIDLRPTTGVLYGVSSASNVYSLAAGGAASFIGALNAPLGSSVIGIDFNPAADLAGGASLRVVSSTGQNYAFNVNNPAAVTATVAVETGFASVAYANNDLNPGTATSLYYIDLDTGNDTLKRADSNFNGSAASPVPIVVVGSLGLNVTDVSGFDISSSGTAFAALSLFGTTTSGLYTINLGSGAATLVGGFGNAPQLLGLTAATAPIPEPETYALMLAGLGFVGWMARRRARR